MNDVHVFFFLEGATSRDFLDFRANSAGRGRILVRAVSSWWIRPFLVPTAVIEVAGPYWTDVIRIPMG